MDADLDFRTPAANPAMDNPHSSQRRLQRHRMRMTIPTAPGFEESCFEESDNIDIAISNLTANDPANEPAPHRPIGSLKVAGKDGKGGGCGRCKQKWCAKANTQTRKYTKQASAHMSFQQAALPSGGIKYLLNRLPPSRCRRLRLASSRTWNQRFLPAVRHCPPLPHAWILPHAFH